MFGTYTGGSYVGWDIEFNNSDKIDIHYYDGSGYVFRRKTTAVYRDTSAWYHIVVAVDTTQSTASDRLKLYVNGVQVTAFDITTNVSQDYETNINTAVEHRIGYNYSYSDFYLADIHFVDAQALAPTDFGEYDSNSVWQPKAFGGTYGTNGFKLNFSDTSSDSALGTDSSGAGNNWSVNNLTAGAAQALPGVSFDGTANAAYLTIPDSSDFTLGSNDFTVEAYVYKKDANEQFIAGSTDSGGSTSSASFVLQVGGGTPASSVRAYVGTSGTTVNSGENITLNKWVHVAFVRDGNTLRLYVDGVQKDSASFTGSVNDSSNLFGISSLGGFTNGKNWNGFISNLRLVNGTCLYPSGTTFALPSAPLTNVTNTKLLCCQSSSSATATTVSPGSITVGNASNVAAGAFGDSTSADDALRDSPVNGASANDTGAGGEITGNYATLNPLQIKANLGTMENGNLTLKASGSYYIEGKSTQEIFSYDNYCELTISGGDSNTDGGFGIGDHDAWVAGGAGSYITYRENGAIISYPSNTTVATVSGYTAGDVLGMAVDTTNIKFYKNGSLQGTYAHGKSGTFFAHVMNLASNSNAVMDINFGQRAFAYPVSGYKCLNAANLSDPLIADGSTAFDAVTYTGNGGTQSITNYNFSPSFVWIKDRTSTGSHVLQDTVRGIPSYLMSDQVTAENISTNYLTSFNADGFSIGSGNRVNNGSRNYVAWAWDAGDNSNKTYAVTVSNPGSGNKFYVDGAQQPTLTLAEGSTYKFDQSSSTNSTHPLRFSTTSDGTHGGGTEYTTGVTTVGTPGSAGAYTQIVIAASAPTLYAYCSNHSGMGFQVNTSDTAGYTIPAGGLNSSAYDQSQTWSSGVTDSLKLTNLQNQFDSNPSTFSDGFISAGTYTLLQGKSIQVNSSIRVVSNWTSGTAGLTFFPTTGSPYGAPVTSSSDQTYAWTGTLEKITVGTYQAFGISQIYVDGVMLVNSGVTPATSVPSISSRIQADPSKGFSIVSYTGTSSDASVAHGLNAAPEFIIIKNRTTSGYWVAGHTSIGWDKGLYLNRTDAQVTAAYFGSSPSITTSTFSIGTASGLANANGDDFIAYCFAPVSGYSSFGVYTGNGSADGPFVYTGFRPAFVLRKSSSSSIADWVIMDQERDPINQMSNILRPNLANTEVADQYSYMDILSNGFKVKSSGAYGSNVSGTTYIWAAFASHPFKTARAR